MNRADEWLQGTDANWSAKDRRWEFPSGATMSFGYLQKEADKQRYRSAAFQFIGFDELTQFTRTQYLFLFSRLRKLLGTPVPLRMRSASNPGDTGHAWVKKRFVDPGHHSRPYVPSRIEDNPYIDQEGYEKGLEKLDAIEWRQLRLGDWTANPDGGMFKREWYPTTYEPPRNLRYVRFWDFAASKDDPAADPDQTVGTKLGINREGHYYVADVVAGRMTPHESETVVRQTADIDGENVIIGMEQEPGASGKQLIDMYRRRIIPDRALVAVPNTARKEVRARIHAGHAEAGHVTLVHGEWNSPWLNEHEVFPHKGHHDDYVDSMSGAMSVLNKPRDWAAY